VAVRALASQRAGLANEAAAAEAQAAVAQRRIPELENDKKAAAAARVRCITAKSGEICPACCHHELESVVTIVIIIIATFIIAKSV